MAKYLDKYPHCVGCPVAKYCGTMCMSVRLCNSYREEEETPEADTEWEMLQDAGAMDLEDLNY